MGIWLTISPYQKKNITVEKQAIYGTQDKIDQNILLSYFGADFFIQYKKEPMLMYFLKHVPSSIFIMFTRWNSCEFLSKWSNKTSEWIVSSSGISAGYPTVLKGMHNKKVLVTGTRPRRVSNHSKALLPSWLIWVVLITLSA